MLYSLYQAVGQRKMTVYIELVIIENFFYDYILLLCAYLSAKVKISQKRTLLSALFGGTFALLYPLLILPNLLSILLKIAVGFLLVFIGTSKNERGRYGLSALFFFLYTFAFAGGVYAFGRAYILPCFLAFALVCGKITKKIYQKMRFSGCLRPCRVFFGGKDRETTGYKDSGNTAYFKGLPVCFISPKLFLELFDEDTGQVLDEMRIHTLAGEKKVRVFQGEIAVEKRQKKLVYFGVGGNIIKKGYEVLLHNELDE